MRYASLSRGFLRLQINAGSTVEAVEPCSALWQRRNAGCLFEVPGQRCNPRNEPKGDRPMAKLKKTDVFTTAQPRSETTFEKTIRASKEITENETAKREEKTARLRRTRLERG